MKDAPSKFNTICEDIMMMSAKRNHGMGTSELNPTKVNLLDILSSHKKSKKEQEQSGNVSPYPLQVDPMIQHLGDLYLAAHQIGAKINNAGTNPLISDHEDYLDTIKKCTGKIVAIKKAIKAIAADLGSIQ
jgi:hypothetical protein